MNGHPLLLASLLTLAAASPCAGLRPPQRPDLTRAPKLQDARTAADLAKKSNECEELGRREIAFDEEQTIGQTVALKIIGNKGLVSDKPATTYVNIVGRSLAERSERPGLPWLFGIVSDDNEANAFSTPGGYVFITTGMLRKLENEAQLAGILAHEIIHITERHASNQYRAFKASTCKAQLASGAAAQEVRGFSTGLLSNALGSPVGYINYGNGQNTGLLSDLTDKTAEKMTREGARDVEEQRSDEEALMLLISAGYAPGEFVKLVRSLGTEAEKKKYKSAEDRARSLESALHVIPSKDPFLAPLKPFGKEQGFVAPPLSASLNGLLGR